MSDNELIAEFMVRKYPDGDVHTHYSMKYQTSWDWLMPVVQKIFDTEFGDKFEEWRVLNGRIVSAIGRIDIIDAHKKVVEFIKWYNAEKLKHKQP